MRGNDHLDTDNPTSGSSSSTQLSPSFKSLDIDQNHGVHYQKPFHADGNPHTDRGYHDGDKLNSRSRPTPTKFMINPEATHLKSHPDRGNGVFATHALAAGTLIEESPVLPITKQEWEEGKMDDTILGSYGFCWRGGGMAIGLGSGKINKVESNSPSGPRSESGPSGSDSGSGNGNGNEPGPSSSSSITTESRYRLVTNTASLFNHSSTPNINYVRDYEKSVIRFTASRAIAPGDELCICYAADESKLWFINSDQARQAGEEEDETEIFPLVEVEVADLLDGGAEEERRAEEEKRLARQKRLEAMKGVPREVGRREQKKAKFFEKQKAAEEAKAGISTSASTLMAPKPARPAPAPASSSPSRTPTPNYPAIPERTVPTPPLPPPLHSSKGQSRHEHVGPVVLTPELDWNEQDHLSPNQCKSDEEWAGIERIKGFTEREEDRELENDGALSKSAIHLFCSP
jgi:tRNA-specific adenosine deaminase 3